MVVRTFGQYVQLYELVDHHQWPFDSCSRYRIPGPAGMAFSGAAPSGPAEPTGSLAGIPRTDSTSVRVGRSTSAPDSGRADTSHPRRTRSATVGTVRPAVRRYQATIPGKTYRATMPSMFPFIVIFS